MAAVIGETSLNVLSVGEKFLLPEIKRVPSPRLAETPPKQSPRFTTSEKTEKVKPPTPAKSPLLRATSASNLKEDTPANPPATEPPSVEGALSLPEPSVSSDSWRLSESSIFSKQSLFSPKRNGDDLKIETAVRSLPTIPDDLVSPLEAPRGTEDPSQLFGGFFAGSSTKTPKLNLDIMTILSSNRLGPAENVKTLKTELLEITGYGKLQPVSQQHENVLFDESMYVCLHAFEASSGMKGNEVYLWSGDKVSEPAVEDALIFARKMARDNDGKLVRLSRNLIEVGEYY